ncbi:iron-sulfur cluster assembly scaffold protein [Aurantiacibacter zhengii]|uniref:Iron-sulfur cluster assembly scaffold protein n=2 Tax=Aurantiacibacter zhengii TaxID=2307003 RepID=A0A418NXK4_9SPHN|nr:iron-sulfur cluster assembly scaffold protein [Aurantiacibacter zhengii]
MLAAAVELAGFPPLEDAQFVGSARSAACGSTLEMDLSLDDTGHITRLGMKVRACAVGQAAAAIFARHAVGKGRDEMTAALEALTAWLENDGSQPDWPDVTLIAPAKDYAGRHGAMLLPWKAAVAALSTAAEAG